MSAARISGVSGSALLVVGGLWAGVAVRHHTNVIYWVVAGVALVYCAGVLLATLGPAETPLDRAAGFVSVASAIAAYVTTWALIYENAVGESTRCIAPTFHHHVDSLYFALTTLATLGFGDFKAVEPTCRWLVSGQVVVDLVIVAAAVAGLSAQLRGAGSRQHPKRRGGGATRASDAEIGEIGQAESQPEP
jgi:voltage-gated potassium channel